MDTTHARTLDAHVRLVDVHKSFGEQVVLRGITLAIERGRNTVILGPSGSGKSVLLRHVVGLERPDRGEVHFEGQRIDRLRESQLRRIRGRMGFLFQLSALFDSMTIAENLAFPLREHTRLDGSERRRLIRETLDLVDLAGVENKFPAELSGGQQKRAALARAIMLRPTLMLYDEPTTGLDPERAAGINAMIRRLQRELGVTGIVVTHDIDSARWVGDRIVMLRDGVLVADGTFSEVAASPDPRVTRFLDGSMTRRTVVEPKPEARGTPPAPNPGGPTRVAIA